MKFSWGQGIFLVMTAFAVLMATFMYRAYHAQEDLVAENYYEQEIRYQQQIDKLDNAAGLGAAAGMDVVGDELLISFPEEVRNSRITGELYLQRPNDARFDDRIPFTVEDGILRVPVADRMKGVYRAQMEWSVAGTDYLTVERIYLQ
jgi:nitrogen fixation protein FixH